MNVPRLEQMLLRKKVQLASAERLSNETITSTRQHSQSKTRHRICRRDRYVEEGIEWLSESNKGYNQTVSKGDLIEHET